MKNITCIGSVTADVLVTPVDSLPDSGTLRSVDGIKMMAGGCAANAAVDIAKMGFPVNLIVRVGNDPFGSYVKSFFDEMGVDTRGVSVGCEPNSVSVVCISSGGERSFLYQPGSSAAFNTGDIDMKIIDESDIVFVAGAMLLSTFDGDQCADFMKKCRGMGKFTALDTAWDFDGVWMPKMEKTLPHLDLFMPSVEEAAMLTGKKDPDEIADALFDCGCKTVVVKTGKHGALVCPSRSDRRAVPTYSKYKPVDSTGAGDSFCAGFLTGLALSWDYYKSAEFANAVGTHCIMGIGASSGIKPFGDIIRFMQENEIG